MLKDFLEKFNDKSEIYLRIKVRPNAQKTGPKRVLDDDTIKIDIAAPAEKNRANQELSRYLEKSFKVASGGVRIISGRSEALKLIKIIK